MEKKKWSEHERNKILLQQYPSVDRLKAFYKSHLSSRYRGGPCPLNSTRTLYLAPYGDGYAIFSYAEPIIYAWKNCVRLGRFDYSLTTRLHFSEFVHFFASWQRETIRFLRRRDGFELKPGDLFVDGKPAPLAPPDMLNELIGYLRSLASVLYPNLDEFFYLAANNGKLWVSKGANSPYKGARSLLNKVLNEYCRTRGMWFPNNRRFLIKVPRPSETETLNGLAAVSELGIEVDKIMPKKNN